MTFNSFPLDVQVCLFQVHQSSHVKCSKSYNPKNMFLFTILYRIIQKCLKTEIGPILYDMSGSPDIKKSSQGHILISTTVWPWMVSGWFVQLWQHKNGLQRFLHCRGGSHQVSSFLRFLSSPSLKSPCWNELWGDGDNPSSESSLFYHICRNNLHVGDYWKMGAQFPEYCWTRLKTFEMQNLMKNTPMRQNWKPL